MTISVREELRAPVFPTDTTPPVFGTVAATRDAVQRAAHCGGCLAIVFLAVAAPRGATISNAADDSIRQFLAQDDTQPAYRAERRLEAESGDRRGWVQAVTTYSPQTGLVYEVTGEGGSGFIRNKVLRAVLDGERDVFAKGEAARSSLAPPNYTLQANGVDGNGLVNVLLTPRRKERALVAGSMTLRARDGDLVCLKGRLAKSPSFWVKNVDIVRHYERIGGAILPVALESNAQLRPFGTAVLHMTYRYLEVDGRPVL